MKKYLFLVCLPLLAACKFFGSNLQGTLNDTMDMGADFKQVSKFHMAMSGTVFELMAYMDGGGPGAGTTQAFRMVIYSDAGGVPGNLVQVSDEVLIAKGSAASWVKFPSRQIHLTAGDYWLGVLIGSNTQIGRLYTVTGDVGQRAFDPNPYASGPSQSFGTPTIRNFRDSVVAVYAEGPTPPTKTSTATMSTTSTSNTLVTTTTSTTRSTTLPASGNVHYVSPSGSDTNSGTATSRFKSISHAMDVSGPGDTVIVGDGTYQESLTPHISGTPTAYITVRAEHDGAAVVDCHGLCIPLQLSGISYWEFDGLVFADSSHAVVWAVTDNGQSWGTPSTHDIFRRVSAYNVVSTGNDHIIENDWAEDMLYEDCVAAGRGRTGMMNFGGMRNTFRRGWVRGDEGTGANCGSNSVFVGYLTSEALFENMIAAEPVANLGPCAPTRDVFDWANIADPQFANTHNQYLGVISTDLSLRAFNVDAVEFQDSRNHVFRDDVAIFDGAHQAPGAQDYADENVTWDHMTLIGNGAYIGFQMRPSLGCSDPRCPGNGYDWPFTATLSRSIIDNFNTGISVDNHDNTNGCLTHFENDIANTQTPEFFDAGANTLISSTNAPCTGTKGVDPSEIFTALNWNTATYGRGAYLRGPTNAPITSDGTPMGAQVLYRYVDGTLTNVHLWPWPMEDRIWKETAIYTRHQQSATWDGVMVNGELRTGGYWQTLQGVYP